MKAHCIALKNNDVAAAFTCKTENEAFQFSPMYWIFTSD